MNKLRKTWLQLVLVSPFFGLASTHASSVINNFGLASPGHSITFGEHVLATGTPIHTQYIDLGVELFPELFYNVQPGFFPTDFLANYDLNGTINDPVSIFFAGPVSAAALAVMTNPGDTIFTAKLNGLTVESFTAATTLSTAPDLTHASDFFGFENIVFDELEIDSQTSFFQMDNLQYTNVPEPGIMSLFATFVLAGLLCIARGRKRAAAGAIGLA